MSKKANLYPYDSSDEEEDYLYLKNVKELSQHSLASSGFLIEVAQSMINNPYSKKIYKNKKEELSKELNVIQKKGSIIDKYFPSMVLYQRNTKTKEIVQNFEKVYKETIATSLKVKLKDLEQTRIQYNNTVEEYIASISRIYSGNVSHNDITQSVISKLIEERIIKKQKFMDTDVQEKELEKQKKIIKKITNNLKESDLTRFSIVQKYGIDLNRDKILEKLETTKAKLLGRPTEKISSQKIQAYIQSAIQDLPIDDFISFICDTEVYQKPNSSQEQQEKELIVCYIKTGTLIPMLLKAFNTNTYLNEHYPINIELRNHLSKQTFKEDFREHIADKMLDHRIIRHSQKVVAMDQVTDVINHSTTLKSGAKTYTNIKITQNGIRLDFIDLPIQGISSAYEALVKELSNKLYSSDIIKKIIHNQYIVDGNQQQGFLYRLTDLLFNCEPARAVSAYLTNAMFFELVDAEIYKIGDLPFKLPMAMKKAVSASRYIYDQLGGTYGGAKNLLTTRQYYDHDIGDETAGNILAARDTALFYNWLIYKGVIKARYKIEVTKRIQEVYKLLTDNIGIQTDLDKATNKKIANKEKITNLKTQLQSNLDNLNNIVSVTNNSLSHFINGSESRDNLYKELHDLIYDWYGIHLEYLYSWKKFEKEQLKNKDIIGRFIGAVTTKAKDNQSLKELQGLSPEKIKEELNNDQSEVYKQFRMYLENPWGYNKDKVTKEVTTRKQYIDDSQYEHKGSSQRTEISDGAALNDKQNAFNQRNNSKYYYQDKDIIVIQKEIMPQGSIVKIFGNDDNTKGILEELISQLGENPVFCIYNPNGGHWVSFVILKVQDQITVLYKDSQEGGDGSGLQDSLKAIDQGIKVRTNEPHEQTSGVECGIFALQNMAIMAVQLQYNQGNFIEGFSQFKGFCSLEDARKLRAGEFAKQYVLGMKKQIQIDHANSAMLLKLREHHDNEVTILAEILLKYKNLEQFAIKPLLAKESLKSKVENTITIQIATPPDTNPTSSNYTYQYMIRFSKNISDEEISKIIEQWPEALRGDYSKGTRVIRINESLVSEIIDQIPKKAVALIDPNKHEVTVNELLERLNVPNSWQQMVNEIVPDLHSSSYSSSSSSSSSSDSLLESNQSSKPLSGNKQENIDIGLVNTYFGKYTLDGLCDILKLRINDLDLNKNLKIQSAYFIDKSNNNITEVLSEIITSKETTILVPLSLFGHHAVGVILEKQSNGILSITYLDSLKKPIPKELQDVVLDQLGPYNVALKELIIEQQKYSNCGPEVVENFVYYLTGKRLSQEDAIEYHSRLVEDSLLVTDAYEPFAKEDYSNILPFCNIEYEILGDSAV